MGELSWLAIERQDTIAETLDNKLIQQYCLNEIMKMVHKGKVDLQDKNGVLGTKIAYDQLAIRGGG